MPPGECYGCGADIPVAPGVAYCATCVAEQLAAADLEREAFDDFHRFADAVASGELGGPVPHA